MRLPVNLTGGSYESRSVPLSAQRSVNFYPELQSTGAQSPYTLMPTPGYTLFGTQTGADRGMLYHKGVLYKVSGTSLYSVSSVGTHTSLGTIAGATPVVMRGFGDNVVIATGEGLAYQYNGATVSQITDPDLENPTWLDALGGHVIYGGEDGRFWVSMSGDATDINALDFATAETNADEIIRGYVFKGQLYLFGDVTTEVWWNSGIGRPPFDPVRGADFTVGIASRMAVNNNDQSIYWLGDDRKPYRDGTNIAKPAISNALEQYTTVNDSIVQCITWEGQNFAFFTFPTEDRTWVYSESTTQWFEMSRSGADGRCPINSHAYAYGKNLVGDYRDGNIFELNIEDYDENGSEITRERHTGVFTSDALGYPGTEVEIHRFELNIGRGVGLLAGQGSDPIVTLSVSYNGGRTFGTERWRRIGRFGEYNQELVWSNLGRGREVVFKIACSDPVLISLYSAVIDAEAVT